METKQDCELQTNDDARSEDCRFSVSTSEMSGLNQEQTGNAQTGLNPGNPIFSCNNTSSLKGVAPTPWAKPQNPLFRTTSNDYGLYPPTAETTPCIFFPKSQKFTNKLIMCGMYQDNCFNTTLDRSRVYDFPNLQHTI
ncbi:piercer of microtubule wall 2 protein-like [Corythoichthys intestinalis]|uniref:piercer of microtubule wall 2 protein-like n=1 Tax=Corythoichthys intestinalis TaxID=161448 RepID=UPI0025A4EFD2|nr:piercer of microtubule wall 2 protein-like [Corythoichthys intestinalis]